MSDPSIVEFPRNSTVARIAEKITHQNTILERLAIAQGAALPSVDWATLQSIAQLGEGAESFDVGDQAIDTWKDTATGTSFTFPWDVVDFGNIINKDAETHPAIWLQLHYASPFGVQFDAAEAFLYTPTGIPIGTYHFTIGSTWGTMTGGKSYEFTLTSPVPAKGQIAFSQTGWPDKAVATWQASSFTDATKTTAIETIAMTEGTDGTDLGTMALQAATPTSDTEITISGTAYKYRLNNMHRSGYGYNRWSQSALRQYLNSDMTKGEWWIPKNIFDRPPVELATKDGFLTGFADDFKAALSTVKVTTALNSTDATAEGANTEDTYDKFFLPALQQMYINPQYAGEGDAWDYYKQLNGTATQYAQVGTYDALKSYAVEAHTSPQSVRLRSAGRGYGSQAWCVYSTGYINSGYAANSLRFRPACAIH